MKKINKFLIIGALMSSALVTGIMINNNINHNEIETNSESNHQDLNFSSSSRSFDDSIHGSVDFASATPIIDLPDGDVEVVVNGYTNGTGINLTENMALVIYPDDVIEGEKDRYMGHVKTTVTDLTGNTTLTITEDTPGSLKDGITYKVYAARETIGNIYDILNDTFINFIHRPKNNAEITLVDGTPTGVTSYSGNDGIIDAAISLSHKGSVISNVEVSLDDTIWVEATTWDQTSASHQFTGLVVGDYNIYVKVTTDFDDDVLENSGVITISQPAPTMTKPTGVGYNASHNNADGSIVMSTTVTTNDANITKIEYQINEASAVDTISIDANIRIHIPNLPIGDYVIKIIVTTDLETITGVSETITIGETPATMTTPIGTPTAASFNETNGSIVMSTTVTTNDANITKTEYKINGKESIDAEASIDADGKDLEITFKIPNLPIGDYVIKIIVTTDLGNLMKLSDSITVDVNQETVPKADLDGSNSAPTKNADGTVTYPINSITTHLVTEDGTFVNDHIGATNARYEIVDSEGKSFDPPILAITTYDFSTGIFSLAGELTINEKIVESGYLIVLTGVEYKGTLVPDIDVEIESETGLEPGEIAIIIFASLFGIGLIGSIGYWTYSKIGQRTNHNKQQLSQPINPRF